MLQNIRFNGINLYIKESLRKIHKEDRIRNRNRRILNVFGNLLQYLPREYKGVHQAYLMILILSIIRLMDRTQYY